MKLYEDAATASLAASCEMISLRRRFFNYTTMAVLAIMLVSLIAIHSHYVSKLKHAAQDTLRLHVYALLSVAQMDGEQLNVPTLLSNPDFNTPDSGLWALVFDNEENLLWQSLSSPNQFEGVNLAVTPGIWAFEEQTINGESYLTAAFKLEWGNGSPVTFQILVAQRSSVLNQDIREFRQTLMTGYIAITLSLLLLQFMVLRLAFRPISQLEAEIAEMEQGKVGRLSADYPKELLGVSKNLNALIDKEHSQRERYRAAMADLAHSLKTPVTIIANELQHYRDNSVLQGALKRMNTSIEYQLQRAVISGHKVLSQGMPAKKVIIMVLDAMEKIYKDRPMIVELAMNEEVLFYGDENDLLEIFGNLIDNAFKYGNSRLKITGEHSEKGVSFKVEDDGPGLTKVQQSMVFRRGERLDQQGLGQGIGLAVVYDIVKGYKGSIEVSESELGGAKFSLTLPHEDN